ncbi:hypothetical protein FHETE_164 [Fusarium heterosporum]|uniref:F-box domain-containing protein n=1 Tax=Fusarium heterosporum TaxID=42747 RepID=A0A8H5X2G5_FUSHE|nr:hypothetical protein FHETE_164 [Fusarium heterosporum]
MYLHALPRELQCQIIRHVDPIGLISLSQTNTQFRHLINPQKKHFAERLLALESLPEYGGPTLIFRSKDHVLQPRGMGSGWDTMRWACTDCLRLLPHKQFDNHSLLRLGYRKPIPESPASQIITSWEPTVTTKSRVKKTERARRDAQDAAQEEKQRRAGYFLSVTNGCGHEHATPVKDKFQTFRECGITVFRGMNFLKFLELEEPAILEILHQNAMAIEGEEAGKKRWLRKCNECRFRKGLTYHPLNEVCGTKKFPIIPSRKVQFATVLDRLFPGLCDNLSHKRPSFDVPLGLIYREEACEQLWTMWMARCPMCERWQELRAFRLAGAYLHWRPDLKTMISLPGDVFEENRTSEETLDKSCCNSCLAESQGRQELTRLLQGWISQLIQWRLRHISHNLMRGFNELQRSSWFKRSTINNAEWKSLLKHTPFLHKDYMYIFSYSDIALLRLRRGQWYELFKAANEDFEEWYNDWVRASDKAEAHWRWMIGCQEEIEENPDILAEWALGRDGAAFT